MFLGVGLATGAAIIHTVNIFPELVSAFNGMLANHLPCMCLSLHLHFWDPAPCMQRFAFGSLGLGPKHNPDLAAAGSNHMLPSSERFQQGLWVAYTTIGVSWGLAFQTDPWIWN